MTALEKARGIAKELAEKEGGETGLATVTAIVYLAGCVMGLTEEVEKIAKAVENNFT